MKTVLELLVAGRDLISDPGRWTTNVLARKENGDSVSPNNKKAIRWCALGAIYKDIGGSDAEAFFDVNRRIAVGFLIDAAKELNLHHGVSIDEEGFEKLEIGHLNDGPDGHARVLRAYDIAIERARAKEAGG